MDATFTTLTDKQRVEVLNNVYQKGMSTSKEALAFSADKLVYLKPFIARLQNQDGHSDDLESRVMARQVIDELIKDILDEIQATFNRKGEGMNERVVNDYGLNLYFPKYDDAFYYANKVA